MIMRIPCRIDNQGFQYQDFSSDVAAAMATVGVTDDPFICAIPRTVRRYRQFEATAVCATKIALVTLGLNRPSKNKVCALVMYGSRPVVVAL